LSAFYGNGRRVSSQIVDILMLAVNIYMFSLEWLICLVLVQGKSELEGTLPSAEVADGPPSTVDPWLSIYRSDKTLLGSLLLDFGLVSLLLTLSLLPLFPIISFPLHPPDRFIASSLPLVSLFPPRQIDDELIGTTAGYAFEGIS
jgi:hypothetical protein